MFEKAMVCEVEVAPKAMMNLAILYYQRSQRLASAGNLDGALVDAKEASSLVDRAKPMLESTGLNAETQQYLQQVKPLRLQCHRMVASVFAGMKDLGAAEAELRLATQSFPDEKSAWQMLARILQVQGKTGDMNEALSKMNTLP